MSDDNQYQKGYAAGRRFVDNQRLELEREVARLKREAHETRQERIYFNALNTVLAHCKNWRFGEEEINNGEAYSRLASIFAKYAISHIDELP